MIDYSKYEAIKTKKIINNNVSVRYDTAFQTQEEQVNNVIEYIVNRGFEIIEITHDNVGMIGGSRQYIYTVTDITYGKLKNPKK